MAARRQAGCASAVLIAVLGLFSEPAGLAFPTVTPGENFTGSTYGVNSQSLPPDCNGAAGPNHFVEFINGAVAVYSKTTGQSVQRKTNLKFWSDAGLIISPDSDVSDPRIIYDPAVQRWFVSQVDLNTTAADPTLQANDFLLAVSAGPDPTGPWQGFMFQADPDSGSFADFPTLGVDANAVYLSGDMFVGSANPIGASLVSIPKADLVATNPTVAHRTWFGVMSYAERGQVLQPATCLDGTSSGAILALDNIGTDSSPHSNLVTFAVQGGNSPAATLSSPVRITVNPYVVPFNSEVSAPLFTPTQPDGTTAIAANDARLSAKVYGVGGVLYAVHNTEINNRIAIRWYRVEAASQTLLESGTIADSNLDLFFPSIAANSNGIVVIACNGCSLNTFVSCYAFVGETAGGTTAFGAPLLLQSGTSSYHGDDELLAQFTGDPVISRWGDYSATSVDPSDPTHFWTIQMYPSGSDVWSTQITELVAAEPAPVLALTAAGSSFTLSWPNSGGTYQVQSTDSLGAGSWAAVSQNPTLNGNEWSLTLSMSGAQQFFRLHKL